MTRLYKCEGNATVQCKKWWVFPLWQKQGRMFAWHFFWPRLHEGFFLALHGGSHKGENVETEVGHKRPPDTTISAPMRWSSETIRRACTTSTGRASRWRGEHREACGSPSQACISRRTPGFAANSNSCDFLRETNICHVSSPVDSKQSEQLRAVP